MQFDTLAAGYGKREVAMAYFPHATDTTARRNLARWIKGDPELSKRLTEAGYNPHKHSFTPTVAHTLRHLGRTLRPPYI